MRDVFEVLPEEIRREVDGLKRKQVSSCCHVVTIYLLYIVHQKDIVLVSFSCYLYTMTAIMASYFLFQFLSVVTLIGVITAELSPFQFLSVVTGRQRPGRRDEGDVLVSFSCYPSPQKSSEDDLLPFQFLSVVTGYALPVETKIESFSFFQLLLVKVSLTRKVTNVLVSFSCYRLTPCVPLRTTSVLVSFSCYVSGNYVKNIHRWFQFLSVVTNMRTSVPVILEVLVSFSCYLTSLGLVSPVLCFSFFQLLQELKDAITPVAMFQFLSVVTFFF